VTGDSFEQGGAGLLVGRATVPRRPNRANYIPSLSRTSSVTFDKGLREAFREGLGDPVK